MTMNKNKKDLISLFLSKTLIFIVVVLMVSTFKGIFWDENSLIGVTSVVLMLVLLQMDLTIHPIENLFNLVVLNLALGLSAFIVTHNIWLGLILNFLVMLFIGYFFSYELKKPVNMMIGLHYMLMVVSPITISQLPLRFLSLIAGAFMIMAVQLLSNKNKLVKSRKKILDSISDTILLKIDFLKKGNDLTKLNATLSESINILKSAIFDSGKSKSHITEFGKNTIDILSCLEKINIILDNINNEDTDFDLEFLDDVCNVVKDIKDEKVYIDIINLEKRYKKCDLNLYDISSNINIYDFINSIKNLNFEMENYSKVTNKQKDIRNELLIPQEFKSINVQKRLINLNSTRIAYGIRLGLVVSLTFFVVDFFNINFGEWSVYTVFALSQPHSEYTVTKSGKRIIGTIIGAVIMAVLFNIVTDSGLRTIMLIAAGYLMSYASDYRDLVIFVTISSIASAAIYVVNPNFIIINRIVFVIIGMIISLIANKLVLPRKLSDEEQNLNNIQRQSTEKMIKEVLFDEGSKNESVIGLLYLVPSLVDLRIDYLKQNGLKMSRNFIEKNKILMTDLYQIYLLQKNDVDYKKALCLLNEKALHSTSMDVFEARIQEAMKSTNNIKEMILFTKVSIMLRDINSMKYDENIKSDLYQFLTIFS